MYNRQNINIYYYTLQYVKIVYTDAFVAIKNQIIFSTAPSAKTLEIICCALLFTSCKIILKVNFLKINLFWRGVTNKSCLQNFGKQTKKWKTKNIFLELNPLLKYNCQLLKNQFCRRS